MGSAQTRPLAQLRLAGFSCRVERHARLGSALGETAAFIQGRIRTAASDGPPSEAVEFLLFQIKRECALPSRCCLTTLLNHNGAVVGGAFFFSFFNFGVRLLSLTVTIRRNY